MWGRLKLYVLKKLYRVLVVKVYTIDRSALQDYDKFNTFCDLGFNTSQGRFNFSFKEDQRYSIHTASVVNHVVSSYLVELTGPAVEASVNSPLHNKVIVVIMAHLKHVSYEALARVLLDLYIDQFPKKP